MISGRILPRVILFTLFFPILPPGLLAQKSYRARADSVIAFYVRADFGKDYYSAIAKLRTGERLDRALAYLDTLLEAPEGDGYWMHATMSVYLHGAARLPEEYRKRIRHTWKSHIPLCRDTEHERLLYYSSLYLAASHFPEMSRDGWFNGKTSDENRTDCREYLNSWFIEAATEGLVEFDSPSVTSDMFGSLFLLHDFAPDTTVRKRATIMLSWLLADFAAEYLDGMYCGAHSREPEYIVQQPRYSAMTAFGSLFFGDVPLALIGNQLLAAISSWTPDPIFRTIATSRKDSYVVHEIKRSKRFLRGGGLSRQPVYKYTYMTPIYAMGSIDGGLVQPVEQHSWDVSWKGDGSYTTLYSMQPVASDTLLALFHPSDENTAYYETASRYLRYQTFNKNSDGSPYERIFQYRSTLIALYRIPPIKTFPIVTAFFPKDLDEFIVDSLKTRWLFGRSGDFYFAYYPFKGYFLLDEEQGRRLVSPDIVNGFVCQVASKRESGGFRNFMNRVKRSRADLSRLDSAATVRYRSMFGDELEFSFDGIRKRNGATVPFDTENLFSSKWMSSRKGSGILTVTDGKKSLILNMREATISRR